MNNDWADMLGWRAVLPPSRPSRDDLHRVEAALADIDREARVGVLGSTPEFSDLLVELGFEQIRMLDNSVAFHELVVPEVVYPDSGELIIGDWQDTLALHPDGFAVLLSDLTAGNISYEARSAFYAAIASALMPRGLFIDKHLVNPGPLLTLDEIDARYRREPFNLRTLNDFNCEAVFCSELQQDTGVVDTSRIYDTLLRRLTHPRLQKFIAATEDLTPRGRVWFYGAPQWRVDPPLERYGLTLAKRADVDQGAAYYGRAFHYIWTKEEKFDDHP